MMVAMLASLVASPIKPDEEVVFFPGIESRTSGGAWELEIRGWIFERESRFGAAELFRKVLDVSWDDLSEEERLLYDERTALFLIDAERGKQIPIQIGRRTFTLPRSDRTGHFSGVVRIAESALQKNADGTVTFRAVTKEKDAREFTGQIHLIEPEGWSVISDIDDTIKVSHVLDKKELLRKTFLKDFTPVPGMAELYQHWATNQSVAFHYLSSSPSQLFPPLNEFIEQNDFPSGSFHLRVLDWRTEWQNNSASRAHKLAVIESLIKRFKQRRFILVGDSGESDPEIYGRMARKYPNNVVKILIRNVTGQAADAERFQKVFRNIPGSKWQLFDSPSEIESPQF